MIVGVGVGVLVGAGAGVTSVGVVVGAGDRVGVGTGDGTTVGVVVGAETTLGCWVDIGAGAGSTLAISGVGSAVEEQATDISRPSAAASPRKTEVRVGWIAIALSVGPYFNLYCVTVRAVRRFPAIRHFESARFGAAPASAKIEC